MDTMHPPSTKEEQTRGHGTSVTKLSGKHLPFKVSLRDIQAATPSETYEEAVFMENIERTDPTGQSMAELLRAAPLPPDLLLSNSKDGSDYARDDRDEKTKSPSSSAPSERIGPSGKLATSPSIATSRRNHGHKLFDTGSGDLEGGIPHHERNKTVEDMLFDFTKSINMAHYEDVIAAHMEAAESGDDVLHRSDMPPPPGQIYVDKCAQTQVDAFASNAGRLLTKRSTKLNYSNGGSGKYSVEDGKGVMELGSDESEHTDGSRGNGNRHGGREQNKVQRIVHKGSREALDEIRVLNAIMRTNRSFVFTYIKNTMLFCILPGTLIAAILFYGCGNPGSNLAEDLAASGQSSTVTETTTGISGEVDSATSAERMANGNASVSWLILFFSVRQVITFSIARAAQYLVVVQCQRVDHAWLLSPLVRLFILQSRGTPLQLVLWGILNFLMLYGNGKFANHWMFYQHTIGLFNADNPSGELTENARYRGAIIFSVCAGVIVAAKRFWVGLHFGKTTYIRYAERLSDVLKMIVDVTRVARLTEIAESDRGCQNAASILDSTTKVINSWLGDHKREGTEDSDDSSDDDNGDDRKDSANNGAEQGESPPTTQQLLVDTSRGSFMMTDSQSVKIDQLLGEWEEPDLQDAKLEEPTLSSIVQFRASVNILDSDYPFSQAFGQAQNRLEVIECSQRLYLNLLDMQRNKISSAFSESPILKFHTIALVAKDYNNGSLDKAVVKELIKLFRPHRNGDITLLEFCKSVDNVYKEIRKLRASIANEGKMNAASERFFNVIFYFFLIFIGLAAIGIDPVALFGVCASFIISFSFMVGGAASDYLQGLLFILVQKPYDIGDRINVASVESDSSTTGAPGWIVKDVSLYHTTVIFGTTGEYATYSNGALSQCRIINMARSPRGVMNFTLQFGIAVPASTIDEFKAELIEYVKSKPREWLMLTAFRMSDIVTDQGYIEYKVYLQHRESWQQSAALQNSLADVQQKAANISRAKQMQYHSPSLPVELTVKSPLPALPFGANSASR